MKHDELQDRYVIHVGADWTQGQVDSASKNIFKDIRNKVSDPKNNHFVLTLRPLRKGCREVSRAGLTHKTVPAPPKPEKKPNKNKN